ncbi:hypothetical protein, partial [Sphingopyxis sp. Root214]|uniref:hypothetical protein n=1 Tax=Sphingopyxis sp. Root214 TaxID=1736491 RepID=UPI001F2A3C90
MMASFGVTGRAVLAAWGEFRRRRAQGYLPPKDSSHIVSILSKMIMQEGADDAGWNAKYFQIFRTRDAVRMTDVAALLPQLMTRIAGAGV